MAKKSRQGTVRDPHAARGADHYETPEACTRALLAVERLPAGVWEPCAGRGAISRVLAATGRRVVSSDLLAYPGADPGITTPVDFLTVHRAPDGVEAIVTNPPFMLADKMIAHGLSLVPRVIVFLRLAALEGAGRSRLIDRSLARLWVGIERTPMMHREGWDGPKLTASAMPFAWFVFTNDHPAGAPFAGRRVSWRAGNSFI